MWGHRLLCVFSSPQSDALPDILYIYMFVYVYVLKKKMFLAEIELELRVFKYTWRRGLHECDPVQDGEQLWAVSCVGAFDCTVQGFHQLLPLSLRHSPLCSAPSSTSHTVIRHSYSFSLCCFGCFAAPLHCSPSVKACCCVSVRVQLFDVHWCYFNP